MSSVRGILRAKGQITIPADIRGAAGLKEGDPVDMELVDGAIVVRPMKAIDASQAWFWTEEWQRGEREADEDFAAGRVRRFDNTEDFLASLDET